MRDDDRAVEQAWQYEGLVARKNGTPPLSRAEVRARLLAGELRDSAGAVKAPYPEFIEARGPFGPVFPAIPAGYRLVYSCGHPPGHHTSACVRNNLRDLAQRAWRRPVTPAELGGLMKVVATDKDPERQMETGIEAILVSPAFLFRVESPRGNDSRAGVAPVLFSLEQHAGRGTVPRRRAGQTV